MTWPGAATDRRSTFQAGLRRWVIKSAPELQFWGYEGGNLLAAIAGAGGFVALHDAVSSILLEDGVAPLAKTLILLTEFPDAAATIGLAVIVLWSIALRNMARSTGFISLQGLIDATAAIAALFLVVLTMVLGVNWITLSAVFFVSASALLRLCRSHPLFLKLGGLLLTAGGFCLAAPGIAIPHADNDLVVVVFTTATGVCVAAAGLMTYRGGMYECRATNTNLHPLSDRSLFGSAGPIARLLEATMDHPIEAMIRFIILPSLFWIESGTKRNAPFMTAMWARLPWRVLTATAALASGTAYGATFAAANLCWAVGDISIGSLDWDRDPIEIFRSGAEA